MDAKELQSVLDSHYKWLQGIPGKRCAALRNANLRNADLQGANLRNADLQGASLQGANLQGADLQGASLQGASLQGASLQGASLQGANLRNADLRNADLRNADLLPFQICPEEGDFIAWKKLLDGIVLKVLVPASAKRTSSLVGRKCRASHIVPLEAYDTGGNLITNRKKFYGWRNNEFCYQIGRKRKADKFDPDIRVECTHGIHFFMTRKEAEQW